MDKDGRINYDEWIMATVNITNLLTNEKLEEAFNIFDKNSQFTRKMH